MISFTRKEQIVILILVIIIGGIIGVNMLINNDDITYEKNDEIEDLDAVEETSSEETEEPVEVESLDEIVIHITGAIHKPGIYTLQMGSRINDAVLLAGGFTDDVDIDRVNLAKKIKDEEKIHIYKIGEEVISSTEIDNNSSDSNKININTADQSQLETLTGIGAVKASKIIEYRSKNKFTHLDDIMNVEGIGEKTFQSIKDKITI